MAKLTFTDRRVIYFPSLLGNREADESFAVRVKRLSDGDLSTFKEAAGELRKRLFEGAAVDEVEALLSGLLDGPHGLLEIDGQAVREMRPLYELAARDFPFVGCVYDSLVQCVTAANELSEEQEKNFERRRGGSGGTQATATAAPSPLSDASAAESNGSTAATS